MDYLFGLGSTTGNLKRLVLELNKQLAHSSGIRSLSVNTLRSINQLRNTLPCLQVLGFRFQLLLEHLFLTSIGVLLSLQSNVTLGVPVSLCLLRLSANLLFLLELRLPLSIELRVPLSVKFTTDEKPTVSWRNI